MSKPVFYDTGNGDIYAGLTKEAVIAAMKEDCDDIKESEIEEVSGDTLMTVTDECDEPTEEKKALLEVYGQDTDAYYIATNNL